MDKAILAFINYIHRTRGASENTEVSYRRDLTKLAEYLSQEAGIDSWEKVTQADLNSYMLYMERNNYASSSVCRSVASMRAFFRYMAKRGKRVLLIDADMRLSVMTAQYDIQLGGRSVGLAHLLSGQCTLEDALYRTNLPNFYLIPIGTDVQAPLSLIATPDFEHLLNAVGESFDLVIVDAPPVGLVIDAAEIAKRCDETARRPHGACDLRAAGSGFLREHLHFIRR